MKGKCFLLGLAICVFSFSVSLAASFDCEKASTPTEKAICSDSQLSELDNALIHAYRKALSNVAKPDFLKLEQRKWINKRDQCNGIIDCIRGEYNTRIASLNINSQITDSQQLLKQDEPCKFFESYRDNLKAPQLKDLEAEHILGRLCDPKYANVCESGDIPLATFYEMGFSQEDDVLKELINSTSWIWVSKVDIDNDGIDEIRLSIIGGSLRCTLSYFYKQNASGYFQQITGHGYDVFHEEGRFCDGGLPFIRFEGKVYVLEVYDTIHTVWIGSDTRVFAK